MKTIKKSEYFPGSNKTIGIETKTMSTYQHVHWHDRHELEYIISGSGTYIINGDENRIVSGMVIYSPPANLHEIYFNTPVNLISIQFNSDIIDSEILSLCAPIISYDSQEYTFSLFEKIYRRRLILTNLDFLYLKNIINTILIDMIQLNNYKPKQIIALNATVRKTIEYINMNFLLPITLEDISNAVSVTPSHLSMVFHKKTGSTLSNYISDLRMRFAKTLIETTDLPINEIIRQSGMNSVANFSRSFKKKYGMSPTSLRKQHDVSVMN